MSLSRKSLGVMAAALLAVGLSSAALADVTTKSSVKNPSGFDARAFFVQRIPVRQVAPPTQVSYTDLSRSSAICVGCQPLIVVGVGF